MFQVFVTLRLMMLTEELQIPEELHVLLDGAYCQPLVFSLTICNQ